MRTSRPAALLLLAGLALGCGKGAPSGPPAFTVMTFNVLCSFCNPDEFDPWDERLAAFDDVFARHDPDLVGLQEIFNAAEVEQIAALLPGYRRLFFHDAEGRKLVDYPDATIFYRESAFELLETGVYWLSDTPDTAWTYGWASAQFWRIVIWARLRHTPSGRELVFATSHVDNNKPNQDKSAPLILSRTEPWAKTLPVIVVGDFNSDPSTTAYATLVNGAEGQGFKLLDGYDLAATHEVLHNQVAAPEYLPERRIDHVFLGGPSTWTVPAWRVDLFQYGAKARYPSDHFAISAKLSL